jgi:hypothetical protein
MRTVMLIFYAGMSKTLFRNIFFKVVNSDFKAEIKTDTI